jgi:GDPmannose 4,6-dehydratase
MKIALILGATGQDAYYLTKLLIEKKYKVIGMIRRSSTSNTYRIKEFLDNPNVKYVFGDITDLSTLIHTLNKYKPDEIYNLAAQSFVATSFDQPLYTAQVDGIGTLNLLEAIRLSNIDTKLYQASTSEMFGGSPPPQNEKTPFYPKSPYASAKVFSYHTIINYRESYNLFASNGILMNHESPFRGIEFFTMKVVKGLCDLKYGFRKSPIDIGNLDFKRDWGHAKDFVEAMWMILQHDKPDDFVVATGESHTGHEFIQLACNYLGMDPKRSFISCNSCLRPSEVDHLQGDYTKIKNTLGWEPKINFNSLVIDMCLKTEELYRKGDRL